MGTTTSIAILPLSLRPPLEILSFCPARPEVGLDELEVDDVEDWASLEGNEVEVTTEINVVPSCVGVMVTI